MQEWQESLDHLRQCYDELENAMHMADKTRIKQCRKWADEAVAQERAAYKKAMKSSKE